MPKVGIVNFDENGNLHTNMVTVTKEQLGVNCWLPARFLGGECDRYYICKYGEKANCQAGPSRTAREKAEHEELGEDQVNTTYHKIYHKISPSVCPLR